MIPVTVVEPKPSRYFTENWIDSINFNAEKHKLPETDKQRTVVCFTSWEKRIDYCSVLINDILERQTVKPDYIFLTLCEAEFPNYEHSLPDDLIKLINDGKVILLWNGEFCAKSYKKVLPVLSLLNDDDIIIVLDDDNYNVLPADIFESRINDLKKFNRPITFNTPKLDQTIWIHCGVCPVFYKKMLNNWEYYMEDDILEASQDDAFLTLLSVNNGYYPITGSKYIGTDDSAYSIKDEFGNNKLHFWYSYYNPNNRISKCYENSNNYFVNEAFKDKKFLKHLKTTLHIGKSIPIAMCECNQTRADTVFYNAVKSLVITNSYVYDLDFTFFVPGYINISKTENMLKKYKIKYSIYTEADFREYYDYINGLENTCGPYMKFILYEIMRKYDWYIYLDDDIIAKRAINMEIIDEFMASEKPFGMADDYQTREAAPVLYTPKYNLEREYNCGVILVNNKFVPTDLMERFKEVNDEYYLNNPTMTRDMAEQTPFNILFKDDVYYLSNEMNFKPISIGRAPAYNENRVIFIHWAGYNKFDLIKDPLSVNFGWHYQLCDRFKMLDEDK